MNRAARRRNDAMTRARKTRVPHDVSFVEGLPPIPVMNEAALLMAEADKEWFKDNDRVIRFRHVNDGDQRTDGANGMLVFSAGDDLYLFHALTIKPIADIWPAFNGAPHTDADLVPALVHSINLLYRDEPGEVAFMCERVSSRVRNCPCFGVFHEFECASTHNERGKGCDCKAFARMRN